MDDKLSLLRHFLAALAYRTQKALRNAPADFESFQAGDGVRTPKELVRHMTSVLGYARTFFIGGHYKTQAFSSLSEEIFRFYAMVEEFAKKIETREAFPEGMTWESFL